MIQDSELKYTVRGRAVDRKTLEDSAPKQQKKPPAFVPEEPTDCFGTRGRSDGFAVMGYSPDHWKAKDAEYARLIRAHQRAPNENKHPGTPDEFERAWLNRNKPRRARSKPYEIESAADTCAELMRKAGWLHVRVEELMKG